MTYNNPLATGTCVFDTYNFVASSLKRPSLDLHEFQILHCLVGADTNALHYSPHPHAAVLWASSNFKDKGLRICEVSNENKDNNQVYKYDEWVKKYNATNIKVYNFNEYEALSKQAGIFEFFHLFTDEETKARRDELFADGDGWVQKDTYTRAQGKGGGWVVKKKRKGKKKSRNHK